MIVRIEPSVVYVTEPDEGDSVNATFCLEASVREPRLRNAYFLLTLNSSSTNATIYSDFAANFSGPIVIPEGFAGSFNRCVIVMVLGDDVIETNEVIVLEVMPLSSRDFVEYINSDVDALTVNILDNDGT